MNEALQSGALSYGEWEVPSSGIFFRIDVPSHINTSQLLSRCIESERVSFLPSEAFSRGMRKNGIRLNFSRCAHQRRLPAFRESETRCSICWRSCRHSGNLSCKREDSFFSWTYFGHVRERFVCS